MKNICSLIKSIFLTRDPSQFLTIKVLTSENQLCSNLNTHAAVLKPHLNARATLDKQSCVIKPTFVYHD